MVVSELSESQDSKTVCGYNWKMSETAGKSAPRLFTLKRVLRNKKINTPDGSQ